jgi:hypothetical protein
MQDGAVAGELERRIREQGVFPGVSNFEQS